VLGQNGINIRTLSFADTSDFGILMMIVNDIGKALTVLEDRGFIVKESFVVAVEVLNLLGEKGINVEYMYAFFEKTGRNAIVIFKIDDAARAVDVLKKEGISILPEDMIQNL